MFNRPTLHIYFVRVTDDVSGRAHTFEVPAQNAQAAARRMLRLHSIMDAEHGQPGHPRTISSSEADRRPLDPPPGLA